MRNRYNVPKRQWRKWSPNAQNVFDSLYSTMMQDQSVYNAHPKTSVLTPSAWRTVAWNAAWIAASSVAE